MSQVSDYTNYQNATQRMQDSFDAERTETRANHEKELKRKEEESAENIAKAKRESNERLESERAQARDEIKKLKDEVYDQSGKSNSKSIKTEQALRSDYAQYREDVKKEADQKVATAEERFNSSYARKNDDTDDRVAAAVAAQKRSEYQQVHDLENELDQYRSVDHDVSTARAEGRAESVQEHEKTNLEEKNRIIQGYERQIASMKRHDEEMGRHYDRQLSQTMFDSNDTAQRQVKNQKEEFIKIFKDDVSEKNRLEKNYANEIQNLKTRQNKNSVQLIDQTLVAREQVAKEKDNTYQKYIAEKDQRFQYDLGQKDAKIKDLETTDDTTKVSPMVTKKINDAAEKRNYAQLEEAQNVFSKNLTAEKLRDSDDRQALSQDYKGQLTNLHRASRRQLDVESRQMRDAYMDLQVNKDTQVNDLNNKTKSQFDRLYLQSATALSEAQKDKQEALTDQKEVLTLDKNTQIDEVNQAQRNQDRDWFMKVNDLRRNYEAKLNIERDEHAKVTHEMRLEFDKRLREQDRVSKRDVDDRARSYEHQMTQQELAFKEKERFLTEHYESELDRMKRTNANLIQTKS